MGKIITLGEVLMRLSTNVGERLSTSKCLHVNYGGSEVNVAISLANFGHQVFFASKIPDTVVGEAVIKQLKAYNVNTNFVLRSTGRLGTYFMESGNGLRGSSVIYDREGSIFSLITENEWQLERMFADKDIFHISGITPALSDSWRDLTIYLIQQAKSTGCKISFDSNYRQNLWTQNQAGNMLRKILPYVDYCSVSKLDARYLLNIPEMKDKLSDEISYYYQKMHEMFPNVELFYSTKRKIFSANRHQLQGTCWMNGSYFESKVYELEHIVDRVGGGDAFSAGILHGILTKKEPDKLLEFATLSATLKHTIHGDFNQFSLQEVEALLESAANGRILR